MTFREVRRPPLRPRLLGFILAGGPCRVALVCAARPMPPWAFASLRCSDAGPGHDSESAVPAITRGHDDSFHVSGRSWVLDVACGSGSPPKTTPALQRHSDFDA